MQQTCEGGVGYLLSQASQLLWRCRMKNEKCEGVPPPFHFSFHIFHSATPLLSFPRAGRTFPSMNEAAFQQCMNPACGEKCAIEDVRVSCGKCGSLLDIR